jgi:predicted nuclease of predicted toxin-antitoxin system
MKFIVDAQLPKKLSQLLRDKGFDSIHTLELPNNNATTDNEINQLSKKDSRVVITKDSDFLNSFYLNGLPYKLILVTTGNIKNSQLLSMFDNTIEKIIEILNTNNIVEINKNQIIIRN